MSADGRLLVGLPDSGLSVELAKHTAAAVSIDDDGATVAPQTDNAGHGTVLAHTILTHAPDALLLSAQIFNARVVTSAALAAAAIDWLVRAGADVVNLSFGLSEDRGVLRDACAHALAAGVVLIGAAPARGAPVFPSSYSEVIRVTGDARCGPKAISRLATSQADYGACVRTTTPVDNNRRPVVGASAAVAHATGIVAAFLIGERARGLDAARIALDAATVYVGPERRKVGDRR